MEFKNDGFSERTPDNRLKPGLVLIEELLDGHCGRRKK
jgi:hypothetical protein